MDRGTWQATVHAVSMSWAQLSNFHFFFGQGHIAIYMFYCTNGNLHILISNMYVCVCDIYIYSFRVNF